MDGTLGTPVAEHPRTLAARLGSVRYLVAASVLAVILLGAGWAFWPDPAPAAGSSGGTGSEAATEDGLQPGWTNAVEECDCLFGGQ